MIKIRLCESTAVTWVQKFFNKFVINELKNFKHMEKYTFLFACISLLLASCAKEESSNVNQDSVYSIYELFYNQELGKTTARATFRFGGPTGTLLDLSEPAVSIFDGDELLYNALTGVHKKEYSGLTPSGTFTYTDLDGNTFTNTTVEIDSIRFPAIDTINSEAAFTFSWVGNPLAEGETVNLTIDGAQQNNFEIFSTSLEGATELVLPVNKLRRLGIGNANCVLQRIHNRLDVDEGTSTGGRMAVWYTTATKTILIE